MGKRKSLQNCHIKFQIGMISFETMKKQIRVAKKVLEVPTIIYRFCVYNCWVKYCLHDNSNLFSFILISTCQTSRRVC